MEKMVTIDVWSDDWEGSNIINVLHDVGIKTAGMQTESIGTFESDVEWERCKSGEIPSLCVCLTGDAMKSIAENVHETKDVEEKPLFLYKLTVIEDVPDTPNDDDDDDVKKVNVIINVGCTTKDDVELGVESMINSIGMHHDCTITKTSSFYRSKKENSLKAEIYDATLDEMIAFSRYLARSFKHECVTLTVGSTTQFITAEMSEAEYDKIINELKQ